MVQSVTLCFMQSVIVGHSLSADCMKPRVKDCTM